MGRSDAGAVRRVSVPEAARLLGISERGVRDAIARGRLVAEKDGRVWVVTLPAVGATASGGSGAVAGAVAEADDLARVERAVAATATRYMGDLRVMLGELREVYEGRIRAADDLAVELRRRAEAAEAERDALRARLAAQDGPHAAQAPSPAPGTSRPHGGSWRACGGAGGGEAAGRKTGGLTMIGLRGVAPA